MWLVCLHTILSGFDNSHHKQLPNEKGYQFSVFIGKVYSTLQSSLNVFNNFRDSFHRVIYISGLDSGRLLTLWFVSNRSSRPFLMRPRSHTPKSSSDAGGMTDGNYECELARAHYTHTHTAHIPTSVRGNVFSVDVRCQCTASPIALTSLSSQSNVKTGMQAPHLTADRKKKKHSGDIQDIHFLMYNRSLYIIYVRYSVSSVCRQYSRHLTHRPVPKLPTLPPWHWMLHWHICSNCAHSEI